MNDRSPETRSVGAPSPSHPAPTPTSPFLVLLAWMVVSIPLLWGVLQTLKKAAALFQ